MQQSALDLKTIIYDRFKPIFLAYDKDQNATLEPNELRVLLADNLGVPAEDITQDQLDWHFNRIDQDNDGKITFDEYVYISSISSRTSSETALKRQRSLPNKEKKTNLSISENSEGWWKTHSSPWTSL